MKILKRLFWRFAWFTPKDWAFVVEHVKQAQADERKGKYEAKQQAAITAAEAVWIVQNNKD